MQTITVSFVAGVDIAVVFVVGKANVIVLVTQALTIIFFNARYIPINPLIGNLQHLYGRAASLIRGSLRACTLRSGIRSLRLAHRLAWADRPGSAGVKRFYVVIPMGVVQPPYLCSRSIALCSDTVLIEPVERLIACSLLVFAAFLSRRRSLLSLGSSRYIWRIRQATLHPSLGS